MDELRLGLEETIWGRGKLITVVGEPGIGKTRLADEFADSARLRGALVLTGRCYEREGAPPYWPWIQAIRAYVSARDPATLRAEMGPGAAAIAQIVPEVREVLVDISPVPPLGPEQVRFRLFDSISTFLKQASKHQPLVLSFDDFDEADTPSVLLLQFITREIHATRLLMIVTYCDIRINYRHLSSQALAQLPRERTVQQLSLRGLSAPDIARFIETLVGIKPSEGVVAAIHQETGGNPLFVTEVARLLVSEHHLANLREDLVPRFVIPQGIRHAIGRRLDGLSAPCRDLLAVAAVIGREFRLEILSLMTDTPGDQLLEILEEALAVRIIHDVPGVISRYGFSHALVHETLYEELPRVRRLRLHRRAAEVLEQLDKVVAGPHLPEIAYHFLQATPLGDTTKAVSYVVKAGDQSMALLAYEEAAKHYAAALRVLERAMPDGSQYCELLLALGEAQRKAGDMQQAKETFRRATHLARQLGATESMARAALGYSGMWSEAGAIDVSLVDLLEDALQFLGEADSQLRSMLLGRLAQEVYLQERGEHLSQQAVEMARRLSDSRGLLNALHSRHATLWRPENLEERLAVATEIVRLSKEVEDKELELQGHYWRLTDLLELGDLPAVDTELQAYAQLAQTLRQPLYLSRVSFRRAMRALLEGRFADAERLAQEALALGQRAHNQTTNLIFGVQLWTLRREQGRLQEVEAALRGIIAQYPSLPAWRCALIFLHSELGRVDEARAAFERLAANDFSDFPRDAFWLIALTLLAEVCAVLDDAPHAAKLHELLLPYAERHVVVGRAAAAYYGSVQRLLGLLATTLGRWDEAESHFYSALLKHAQVGARPWLAHTQYAYAALLLQRGKGGDRQKAGELLAQAVATAQELGMNGLQSKVQSLKSKVRKDHRQRTKVKRQKSESASQLPDARPQTPDARLPSVFRREGDYWTIVYAGAILRLKNTKGLHYIAHLLRHPGREFHVADLVAAVDKPPSARFSLVSSDLSAGQMTAQTVRVSSLRNSGAVLDRQAQAAYKQRLAILREELAEAERNHDLGRTARLQQESDFITAQLAGTYGLGGHARKTADATERARKAVANRIKESLAKMRKPHPSLWLHLFNALKTGTFCSYTPEKPTVWDF
jgi:tetratricopeptide (TPR) repeat protein